MALRRVVLRAAWVGCTRKQLQKNYGVANATPFFFYWPGGGTVTVLLHPTTGFAAAHATGTDPLLCRTELPFKSSTVPAPMSMSLLLRIEALVPALRLNALMASIETCVPRMFRSLPASSTRGFTDLINAVFC